MKKIAYSILLLAALAAPLSAQSVSESDWGKTKNGEPVKMFTLKNSKGMTAKVITYGATLQSLTAPDRNGKFADVVFGFDKISDYETLNDYYGAIVGRYGNRIANGTFSIDGKEYKLTINNGPNSLHGGLVGFDQKVWKAEASKNNDSASVKLTIVSPDGDQGYPGNLTASVTYTLNNQNELIINYSAESDKPTVANLTNHSYFNLYGAGNGNILNHEVTINADKFTPVDETLIPTGELKDVENTPVDFRKPKPVGSRIDKSDEQLKFGGGYDHNFVLNKKSPNEMTLAARVYEPISGRKMLIYTTEPGLQFYSGNFLKGTKGKGGKEYEYRYGMCFETQHFPDSPNQKDFPSTLLKPGTVYHSTTIFKF